MSLERIDKIIASQCNLTRTDVKKSIKMNLVRVNGQVVNNPKQKYETESINIDVNGEKIDYKKHIYIMLNKPKGVVSATKDTKVKTVVDLVPDELKRDGLFPAGRLDGDTTGFVLITDDGNFAHEILAPKKHVMKTYEAILEKNIEEKDLEKLENGIELADGTKCINSKVEVLETYPKIKVEIKICEGKYHQVKRMFAATGNKVTDLKRIAIGNLNLDNKLNLGECREITSQELQLIKK